MNQSYERFQPPKRILLGPGPSPVDDRVLSAMAAPLLGHLDPLFLQCMDDVQSMLRYAFETENRVTVPKPRALALVQAETSTGVLQDLSGLGEMAHQYGALLIVDAVTSLAGHPVGVDRNSIDICYSGTQKCIGAPPGLAPITFNEGALERIRGRKSKVQSWYLDITMVEHYWGDDRTYHHTALISMNYALREALRLIHEEGLETRWRRHERNHLALVAGVEAMGLSMAVAPEHRLWSLNAVSVPPGVDDARVRGRLLAENIEIGGGLGPLKGRIWRIGLMGSGSTRENVRLVLEALHRALNAEGFECPSGVEAAEAVYKN